MTTPSSASAMQNDPSALLAAFNPAVVANRAGSSMESLQGLSEFAQELLNHVNLVRQQRAAAMAEADAVGATTAHPDTVVSVPPQASTIGTVSPPPREEQERLDSSGDPQPEPVLSAPAAALPEQQGQVDNIRGGERVDNNWQDEDAALGDHPMFNHFDDDGDLALADHPLFNPRENEEGNNAGSDDQTNNYHNRHENNAAYADTVVKQEEDSVATPAEAPAAVLPVAVTPPIKQEPEQESDPGVLETAPAPCMHPAMPPDPVLSASTTDSAGNGDAGEAQSNDGDSVVDPVLSASTTDSAGNGDAGEAQINDGDSVAQNYDEGESQAPTEAFTNAITTAAFTPRLRRPPQVKREFPCAGRNTADSEGESVAQNYEEEDETPTAAATTTTAALPRRTSRGPQPKRHFSCEGRNTAAAGVAAAPVTTNTNARLKVEAKLGNCPSMQPPAAAKRHSVSPAEMNVVEHNEKPPAKKLKTGKKKAPKKNVKVADLSDDEIEVVKVTPQSVGINDSTMPRSVGLTRAVLNKHLDTLGLLTFGQGVVSSKWISNRQFFFSHLTLNMDWNDLPKHQNNRLQWWLGLGANRLTKALPLDPAQKEQMPIPIFWAEKRNQKGGSLCRYVGHFKCVSFDRKMKEDEKRKIVYEYKNAAQALLEFEFVKFDTELADKLAAIHAGQSEAK